MFKQSVVGVIGGGNMGASLVGGLVHANMPRTNIIVTDHNEEKRRNLQSTWGITVADNSQALAKNANIIVLAVKPNAIQSTLMEIAPCLASHPKLLISIAAGITTTQMHRWLKQPYPIVRAMPNTPALYGQGISGLFATASTNAAHRQEAEQLLQAMGQTVWLHDESLMDAVTALSGSGPAYFFYFMEALVKGAQRLGLPEEIAKELTLKTAMGSAYMAIHSHQSLTALRQKVTSPGGTTEQAIKVLKDGNIDTLLHHALEAANNRSQEISKLYD